MVRRPLSVVANSSGVRVVAMVVFRASGAIYIRCMAHARRALRSVSLVVLWRVDVFMVMC